MARKVNLEEARRAEESRPAGESGLFELFGLGTGAERTFIALNTFAPGARRRRHYHRSAEEFLYILSGEVVLYPGEEEVRLRPGDILHIPRGVHHHGVNPSPDTPCRSIILFSGARSLEETGRVHVE